MNQDRSSDIDRISQYNISRFADLNPDYSVTLVSDSPERIKSAWQEETRPHNLHIEKVDYNFGAKYPRVSQVTKGIIPQLPQLSKDLLSYKFLSEQSGLAFDVDITWNTSLPFPLHLNEEIAVHQKFENGFIASPESEKEHFNNLLLQAEEAIPTVFAIEDNSETGTSLFAPTYQGKGSLQYAVNTIEYVNFLDLVRLQKDAGDLQDYASYSMDRSSYPQNKPDLTEFKVKTEQH